MESLNQSQISNSLLNQSQTSQANTTMGSMSYTPIGSNMSEFVGRWKDHNGEFYNGAVSIISEDGTWSIPGLVDDGKAWYH